MNSTSTEPPIKRALISVSNKTGILALAQALADMQVTLLSTGGTAQLLREAGILVEEVSEYTGFAEIMAGRVKTLHPKVHGGLLGRRGIDDDVMQAHSILPIDLLVVNLYPFAETIQRLDCSLEQAIEQIDIGGPSMLRSAAKNYAAVTTLASPDDYSTVIEEMRAHQGATTLDTRFKLAQKAFAHTAHYEATIANYLNGIQPNTDNVKKDFPNVYTVQFTKKEDLRYGENPHQKAAFYIDPLATEASVATAKQQQGKPLSYNNIADTDAALECVKAFNGHAACAIVKHANPCGVAIGDTQIQAYQRAFATDPSSAFGGIIAFNQPLQGETAQAIVDHQFVEVLIAPEIEEQALIILAKKPNIRVLVSGHWQASSQPSFDYQRTTGGLLVQARDNVTLSPAHLKIVTQREPTVPEFNDLLFAWEVVKCVKSNAIVYAKNRATIGIGAGQMSRVFSATIAAMKATEAGLSVTDAVMASDAFFPFRDGVDAAAKAGVTAIIQPGGSIRDAEVIQAADAAGIAMLFTNIRHFRH